MTPAKVGILVLAAGGSTRMGRPKQLLRYRGKTLILHASETALAVGRPVVVVVGAEAENVSAKIRDLPLTIVPNSNWANGMGSSIRTGLQALIDLQPDVTAVLITLCDQPQIAADVLCELVVSHETTGKPLCAVRFADTVGPPALFASTFFAEMLALSDAHGAKQILMRHYDALLSLPCPEAALDVDTPDDYESLAQPDTQ